MTAKERGLPKGQPPFIVRAHAFRLKQERLQEI